MSAPVDVLAVLRKTDADTNARYLGREFGLPALVTLDEAMPFKSAKAAESFLRSNTEFRGYRVETIPAALARCKGGAA